MDSKKFCVYVACIQGKERERKKNKRIDKGGVTSKFTKIGSAIMYSEEYPIQGANSALHHGFQARDAGSQQLFGRGLWPTCKNSFVFAMKLLLILYNLSNNTKRYRSP